MKALVKKQSGEGLWIEDVPQPGVAAKSSRTTRYYNKCVDPGPLPAVPEKKGAKKKLINARTERKNLCGNMERQCQQVMEVLEAEE